jgi:hypothetical protein
MTTTGVKGDFDNSEPLWSTTLPKNSLYEGEVFNSTGSVAGETRHSSEAKGKVFSTAVGKMVDVKVEVVDQSRHAADFMPPGVSALLTSTYNKTKTGMEQVQRIASIFGYVDLDVKPLKIQGEKYNDEAKDRHYLEVTDGNIIGGFELAFEKLIYPPFLKPLNIAGVSKCGLSGKASIDLPIKGGIEQERIYETQKLLINKPFYISGGLKGCLEAGLEFELLVAKNTVDVAVKGYGKGCGGGSFGYKNGNGFQGKVSIDPVVVGINAVVKSKGYITFSLVDWSYEYALTKEIPIYP